MHRGDRCRKCAILPRVEKVRDLLPRCGNPCSMALARDHHAVGKCIAARICIVAHHVIQSVQQGRESMTRLRADMQH